MPPFAGDIGTGQAGSLKWIAQIPHKEPLQLSLEGRFKKSFLGLNVGDQEVEKLFLVSPQNTSS